MSYPQSGSYRSMRASNADRDRAVDSLRAAYAEGRLNDAEFRHRVDEVLRSVTYGELERWTHDIPNGPVPPQLYAQHPAALPPALRGPGYPVRALHAVTSRRCCSGSAATSAPGRSCGSPRSSWPAKPGGTSATATSTTTG